MNLDELVQKIREISSDTVVQRLADLLLDWKTDDHTARELSDDVERYIGNSWIKSDEDHSKVYGLWTAYHDEVIAGIGGLTMNERLHWFSLFERFDAAPDEGEKLAVYAKLHAVP